MTEQRTLLGNSKEKTCSKRTEERTIVAQWISASAWRLSNTRTTDLWTDVDNKLPRLISDRRVSGKSCSIYGNETGRRFPNNKANWTLLALGNYVTLVGSIVSTLQEIKLNTAEDTLFAFNRTHISKYPNANFRNCNSSPVSCSTMVSLSRIGWNN